MTTLYITGAGVSADSGIPTFRHQFRHSRWHGGYQLSQDEGAGLGRGAGLET